MNESTRIETRAHKWKALALSIVVAFALSISLAGIAEATTLFTYSGSGIQNKASVKTAYLSSGKTCSVNHTQSRVYAQSGTTMNVAIQKQSGVGWSTVSSRNYLNDVKNQVFSSYCSAGTYRLYFKSSDSRYPFNISGSFYY